MSKRLKRQLKQILIGLSIFAVLMVVEHTCGFPGILGTRWGELVLYLIPYLIAGRDVVKKCFLGIKNRQLLDECFLMTLATVGAFVTGENSEAVAVMLFYQVGEWFQSYAVGKSRRSITELMDIAPDFANVERADGSIEEVDPEEVQIGDTLVIRAGEKIPVDGTVLEGQSMVNTSALTGESVPRSAVPGDQIISGCINGEGLLKIRAEKKYEDSTVAQILELVENASSKKSKTENFITRFARYYTPIVVAGAVILALIPPIFTGNWMNWMMRACTFLVISCPCALVISVPLSFFGGIGAASNIGVLVKGSNYLEQMAHLDTVVSDKTGTLTEGVFHVTRVVPAEGVLEETMLRNAAIVESLSTHPIAKSIQAAYTEVLEPGLARDARNISGQGLIAKVGDSTVYVGNKRLMEENGIDYREIQDGESTVVYVAADGKFQGAILISDEIKDSAVKAIREMKQEGVRHVVMLTGDRKGIAEAVAEKLSVDEFRAELLPADKVQAVEELLARMSGDKKDGSNGKKKLAFIGDGINDAPVLSRADVGIAMGSMGSDAAIEAADVVIMDDDIGKIPRTIRIARQTVGIAYQNIAFALFIKILFLILGALGIIGMWWAVFADVGVAVICILNSMRMLKRKGL
ncbi:MAG: heavy metal translocating P-type ATPase [Clostridia bacterium]|uniref:Cd(2+)-exporting ATPase n=1 Tax=Mogibacterium kristiansenii TaxID=2606708 RepID=A0A6N7XKP0_9FIRM|nr:heavy metal translocating P-type ATPase [Mogibacterium kristiansenii]MDY5450833.1 heavy metal translocating P-type ATPase [Clostridia bacterium]MST70625.1 cadmium-translocating P-type ATPase [Mogibacterium kristiansenii]